MFFTFCLDYRLEIQLVDDCFLFVMCDTRSGRYTLKVEPYGVDYGILHDISVSLSISILSISISISIYIYIYIYIYI